MFGLTWKCFYVYLHVLLLSLFLNHKSCMYHLKIQVNQFYEAVLTLQTYHVYSTLKRRGNVRFYVVSTWNTRGVFVGWSVVINGLFMPACFKLLWGFFHSSSWRSLFLLSLQTHLPHCLLKYSNDLEIRFTRNPHTKGNTEYISNYYPK